MTLVYNALVLCTDGTMSCVFYDVPHKRWLMFPDHDPTKHVAITGECTLDALAYMIDPPRTKYMWEAQIVAPPLQQTSDDSMLPSLQKCIRGHELRVYCINHNNTEGVLNAMLDKNVADVNPFLPHVRGNILICHENPRISFIYTRPPSCRQQERQRREQPPPPPPPPSQDEPSQTAAPDAFWRDMFWFLLFDNLLHSIACASDG